jgi:hypothetical protein
MRMRVPLRVLAKACKDFVSVSVMANSALLMLSFDDVLVQQADEPKLTGWGS